MTTEKQQEIRLECLKLAKQTNQFNNDKEILKIANEYYDFVNNSNKVK